MFADQDGTLFVRPPPEDGVVGIPEDELVTAVRTKVVVMGHVDVPSATLTIALAYPPLNTTSDGDHAGVTHAEGERLDIPTSVRTFVVKREFAGAGQVVALRPRVD